MTETKEMREMRDRLRRSQEQLEHGLLAIEHILQFAQIRAMSLAELAGRTHMEHDSEQVLWAGVNNALSFIMDVRGTITETAK